MKSSSDRFSLIDLPRKLRETYGLDVTYHMAWRAVVDGALPATRVGSRWFIETADLPVISAAFSRPSNTSAGSTVAPQPM
jgi:hypothetical protein